MIRIDPKNRRLIVGEGAEERSLSFSDPEAFAILSDLWLQCGFDNKYVYNFSWLGRPILQLPEDLVRVQEAIYQVQPDLIVETGVAHGGSLVFYASLCKAMGKGRVVGVEREWRPHNRQALAGHFLKDWISVVEGDSVEAATLEKVREHCRDARRVLVILDSKHSKEHVLAELEAYAGFVSAGSYLIAADGIMAQVAGSPLAGSDWSWNNPQAAVREFLGRHPEFESRPPDFLFHEGLGSPRLTYWTDGYLRRIK